MDKLKEPIIFGLLIGTIAYGYLYYEREKKTDPYEKSKPINLTIPIVVALIGWVIMSNGKGACPKKQKRLGAVIIHSDELSPFSARMPMAKMPRPDVFMDIAKFPF